MSMKQLPAAIAALAWFLGGCASSSPPVGRDPSSSLPQAEAIAEPVSASPPEKAEAEQLPVPDAVVKVHRKLFEPHEGEAKIGRTLCLVTHSDPLLESGHFYPLVLVAGGSVATWRQTSEGPKDLFDAKLGPEELQGAMTWIDAIPSESTPRIEASATVIGVSTRVGDQVKTRYFDRDELPTPVSQLIAMLKHRLEATNSRPK